MSSGAAIWSAVAASFAALSSGLTMMIHRRMMLEAARPELDLLGWHRQTRGAGESAHEVLVINGIRNAGAGNAFRVFVQHPVDPGKPNVTEMSTIFRPLVCAGEGTDINAEVVIWWKNVEPDETGGKSLSIEITTLCWDRTNRRHRTIHECVLNHADGGSGYVYAPDKPLFMQRRTQTVPMWRIQTRKRFRKIPGLGRCCQDLPPIIWGGE